MWISIDADGLTSMAPDPPPIGMSSFTPTAGAFLARKFTARRNRPVTHGRHDLYRKPGILRQFSPQGTYWIRDPSQHDLWYARRVGLD